MPGDEGSFAVTLAAGETHGNRALTNAAVLRGTLMGPELGGPPSGGLRDLKNDSESTFSPFASHPNVNG